MKYQIMLEILFLLLAKKRLKAKEIAIEFGISTRTVMRYVRAIELAGIPIYTEKGRYGGFYIADNYKIKTNVLSQDDIMIITDLLSSCKHGIGLKRAENLKNKLIALGDFNDDEILNNDNRIIIVNEDSQESPPDQLTSTLIEAIKNCNTTVIRYTDTFQNVKSQTLEPHAILLRNGIWHLLAYSDANRKFTTFKVRDISEVVLCKQTFTRKKFVA